MDAAPRTWIYRLRADSTHMDKITEDGLKQKLRSGMFSGLELVRPFDGAGDWVLLYTLPIFRETFGIEDKDEDAARKLAVAHATQKNRNGAAALVGAMVGLFATGGAVFALTQSAHPANPLAVGIGVLMAVGLFAGFFSAASKGAADRRAKLANLPVAAPVAKTGTPVAAPIPAAVPAGSDLDRAMRGLEEALAIAPESVRASVDMGALRKNVESVKKARASLAGFASSPRDALAKELEDAKKKCAEQPDSAAFAERLSALEAHLSSLDGVLAACNESAARERALIHEIEALHLSIARAGVDGTQTDELLDRLRSLRDRLDDESRIADELDTKARARALGPIAAGG